eukprot:707468-Prymnesium_polylepis.1
MMREWNARVRLHWQEETELLLQPIEPSNVIKGQQCAVRGAQEGHLRRDVKVARPRAVGAVPGLIRRRSAQAPLVVGEALQRCADLPGGEASVGPEPCKIVLVRHAGRRFAYRVRGVPDQKIRVLDDSFVEAFEEACGG